MIYYKCKLNKWEIKWSPTERLIRENKRNGLNGSSCLMHTANQWRKYHENERTEEKMGWVNEWPVEILPRERKKREEKRKKLDIWLKIWYNIGREWREIANPASLERHDKVSEEVNASPPQVSIERLSLCRTPLVGWGSIPFPITELSQCMSQFKETTTRLLLRKLGEHVGSTN